MMKAYVQEKAIAVDLYYNDLYALESSIIEIEQGLNKQINAEFWIPINIRQFNFFYLY